MLKVGLTGGYATGKTFVASELQRLGCHVIHADELGHAVLLPEGEAYGPTLEVFGKEILSANGEIDRKKLASIVFTSPELLEKLNSFVHPAVFRVEQGMLAAFQAEDPRGIAVLEAAILIEAARYSRFDRLILTACDEETQIARGIKRDHLTREEVIARLLNQMPLEEKKKYAHYVVDTSGSKQHAIEQTEQIYEDLRRLGEARER